MNFIEAIEVFGINDIAEETPDSIRKKYKRLMVKWHPDNNGGSEAKAKELTLAFEIVSDAVEKIQAIERLNEKRNVPTIVIPIEKLVDIYAGERLRFMSGASTIFVGRQEIQKFNTMIMITADVQHKSETRTFCNIQPWSINDEYSIDCDIDVKDVSKEEMVSVQVGKERGTVRVSAMSVLYKMKLNYNIGVAVRIKKKYKEV